MIKLNKTVKLNDNYAIRMSECKGKDGSTRYYISIWQINKVGIYCYRHTSEFNFIAQSILEACLVYEKQRRIWSHCFC